MIFIYRILTNLLYPFLILLIFFRKLRNKEDAYRYKEKIFPSFFNVKKKKKSNLLWFHAASIGEIKSILPIIYELKKLNPKNEVLITTVTLSSGNLVKEEIKKYKNVYHRFFPVDVRFLIKKFLTKWNPKAIFFVDSEIWPNLIIEANEKKIPLAILNARITKKTFNRWKLFKDLAKILFGSFKLCLASNLETKKYFLDFGVKNTHYNGNIKLIDNSNEIKLSNPNERILKNKRFWFAVSTHEGEEDFILKTHYFLKKKYKDLISIIAPRHINRVYEIRNLCNKFGYSSQILHKNEEISINNEIIIINSFGGLRNYFKVSKSVLIGKSLLKNFKNNGGQNPLEAAKLGCKIYHGSWVYNFQEIYKLLEKYKISQEIMTPKQLSRNLSFDLRKNKKDNKNFSIKIKKLGKKTLLTTMMHIKIFYRNEIN